VLPRVGVEGSVDSLHPLQSRPVGYGRLYLLAISVSLAYSIAGMLLTLLTLNFLITLVAPGYGSWGLHPA